MTPRRARLVHNLASRLAAATISGPGSNEVELEVRADDLPAAACVVLADRGHLLAAYGSDESGHPDGGGLRLRYVFDLEGEDLLVVIRATIDPEQPYFPSVAPVAPAAAWPEREIRDLLGVEPIAHPDPRPLHRELRGLRPLRRDTAAATRPSDADGGRQLEHSAGRIAADQPTPLAEAWAPVEVEGESVHTLLLGPGHGPRGGGPELRFALHGERVIHLEPHLFSRHRGVETGAAGRSPDQAMVLAERACGRCAVANAAALAQALERLAGCEPPPRARWLRTALLELERLASHAATIAELLARAGLASAAGLAERAGEAVRQALEDAFGSRLGLAVVRPGGARRDLSAAEAKTLVRAVRQAAAALRAVTDQAIEDATFTAALAGKGVLPAALAAEWEVVGPTARASGSRRDVRRDHPTLAYDELQFWVPLYGTGDALGRFRIHADEAQQSAALIEESLENLPAGAVAAALGPLAPHARALGLVESARGAALCAVHSDGAGRIERYHLRGAAAASWTALAAIAPGSLLGDWDLVEASFDLCDSCVGR
jgi:Ni,Fe-hydrogenase III large subunit/Ni,Fe-hydrogenase III component G